MSLPTPLTDLSHVLLAGGTGAGTEAGGKTTVANYLHQYHASGGGGTDCQLFFNSKHHIGIGDWGTVTVNGLGEFRAALERGETAFDYRPTAETTDDEADEHSALMTRLRKLTRLTNRTWLITHDEAADYAHSARLEWAVRRGGNLPNGGLKSVVIAQRPWDLPETVRTNVASKGFVGLLPPEIDNYLQALGLTGYAEEVREWHTEPFRWSLLAGRDLHRFRPVAEAYVP